MNSFQRTFTSLSLAIAIAMLATHATLAHAATPMADQRQVNQSQRIASGEASGKLSSREASRLKAGQAKVGGMESAAKADGKVTRAERAAIQKAQNKQSRRIYRQKHDANKR